MVCNGANSDTDVIDILTLRLDSMREAGYLTNISGINSATITTYSDIPPTDELDNEPISTSTSVTPHQLTPCPYKFRLTLPTNSPATAGLLLLASRQVPWTTCIPEEFIPTRFPEDLRQSLLQQIPTIIRANNIPPQTGPRHLHYLQPGFTRLTPRESLRQFRAAVLHTLHKILTSSEYRQPHDSSTMATHLSPHAQALLQIIDSIKPATS
jgi:hypothetical protein